MRYRTEKRTDVPALKTPKKSLKVMDAAGFCGRGVTELHIVTNGQNIDAKYYRDQILPVYFKAMDNKVLFPNKKKVTFQQDGAPAHTSKDTMKLINAQTSSPWGKDVWPGNSPDLNPIENLWSYLKSTAYEEPVPHDRQSLIKRFQKKWKAIPKTTLENLSQSFQKRILDMKNVSGGSIRY